MTLDFSRLPNESITENHIKIFYKRLFPWRTFCGIPQLLFLYIPQELLVRWSLFLPQADSSAYVIACETLPRARSGFAYYNIIFDSIPWQLICFNPGDISILVIDNVFLFAFSPVAVANLAHLLYPYSTAQCCLGMLILSPHFFSPILSVFLFLVFLNCLFLCSLIRMFPILTGILLF